MKGRWGAVDYPFVENSAKIINYIFQSFSYLVSPYQVTLLGQPTHIGAAKKLRVLVRFLKPFVEHNNSSFQFTN